MQAFKPAMLKGGSQRWARLKGCRLRAASACDKVEHALL